MKLKLQNGKDELFVDYAKSLRGISLDYFICLFSTVGAKSEVSYLRIHGSTKIPGNK